MPGVDGGVQVVHGVAKLVSNDHFALALFALLYEVADDDGAAVPSQQVLEVGASRVVRRIDAVEDNGRLGHCDARLLRPVRGYASPYLQVGRKSARRSRRRLSVKNLLVFDVVGDLTHVRNASLQVPRPGEVPRPPGQKDEIHGSAVIIELSLQKCTVYDGQNPMEGSHTIGAIFQFSSQKEVPRVHILEGWRRKGLRRHG
mmetsp:Transcript_41443/g.125487  ORF Transcript_41443/g.125487 Transcript_41443/m.125487 type:complete len:201 (+) Transcript_41443:2278-2880(+)